MKAQKLPKEWDLMAIVQSLLTSSETLQQYLVDKDTGTPLAGGVITLYKDDSRQELKNWFYQTGSPGQYTFVALDNPLTLSSVGTIQDPNGNDVIPFYYPFKEDNSGVREAYYIVIKSSGAIPQFTRENFPFANDDEPIGLTTPTLTNYIVF